VLSSLILDSTTVRSKVAVCSVNLIMEIDLSLALLLKKARDRPRVEMSRRIKNYKVIIIV